jgi:hypothetical protein
MCMSLLPSVVASTSASQHAPASGCRLSALQLFGVGSLLVLDRESFATTRASPQMLAAIQDLAEMLTRRQRRRADLLNC